MRMPALALVMIALIASPGALAQQQRDFSKTEIKTTKLADNFYALEGEGGRIGVLAGPDGILMVDSQFAPLTERIVTAIKQISNGRIRFLINTHVHGDHIGGNENFARLGATIMARENLRARMIKPSPSTSGQPGVPALALPVVTYDVRTILHMNGEEVHLIPVPVAHTDGDTMIYFPKANVIMTGDFYRSAGYPNIDRTNGGTINGMLAGLEATLKLGPANAKIAPGHGPIADKAAVAAHRDMMIAVRDKVAAMIAQNKTQEEVVAAKPTAEFDAAVGGPAGTADRFIAQLYQELKGGR